MSDATRDRLLATAKTHFAERGFYGASIAQIATELGLTKQALLYHFKRKEDLYAEILQAISERLIALVHDTASPGDPPERRFEDMILGLFIASREYPLDSRIITRELLDNQIRAKTAKSWYLEPFLEELVAALQAVPGLEKLPASRAFCIVYQLLGSIEYFAISGTTLESIYGASRHERFRADFPIELRHQIRRYIDEARSGFAGADY
ncbi:MAG: TetR/AcrR family transcriptional regulator [Pseudomonadota bacterium]